MYTEIVKKQNLKVGYNTVTVKTTIDSDGDAELKISTCGTDLCVRIPDGKGLGLNALESFKLDVVQVLQEAVRMVKAMERPSR